MIYQKNSHAIEQPVSAGHLHFVSVADITASADDVGTRSYVPHVRFAPLLTISSPLYPIEVRKSEPCVELAPNDLMTPLIELHQALIIRLLTVVVHNDNLIVLHPMERFYGLNTLSRNVRRIVI